jgi:hypothetical protein
MEMMKAKVFLSSTGDVHLRHKVIQVITKSGAYEPGQVGTTSKSNRKIVERGRINTPIQISTV